MKRNVIMITGAAGFLGSALALDLSRDHQIIGVDRRRPTEDLLRDTPGVWWRQTDISDQNAVAALFHEVGTELGRIDFVIHFAVYCDFATRWHGAYEKTNVVGTANVLHYARQMRVKRLLFASSIAALAPPAAGVCLTEKSPLSDYIPYARSKLIGEEIVLEDTRQLPVIVLRLAGVFSDWCELPPLSSLLKTWTGGFPLNRILAGKGLSGIPYIHRADVLQFIRRCLDRHEQLDPAEIFLVSQDGQMAVMQQFPPSAGILPVNPQIDVPYLFPEAAQGWNLIGEADMVVQPSIS